MITTYNDKTVVFEERYDKGIASFRLTLFKKDGEEVGCAIENLDNNQIIKFCSLKFAKYFIEKAQSEIAEYPHKEKARLAARLIELREQREKLGQEIQTISAEYDLC